MKRIKRKKASEDLTGQESITCYIEIENKVSRGTLAVKYPDSGDKRLLEEVKLFTPEIVGHNREGRYQFLTGNFLSKKSIDELTSRIISELSFKTEFLNKNITSLFAYSDAFINLDKPQDTSELVQEILTSCENKFSVKQKKFSIPVPQIAANENKSLFVAKGAKNILSGYIDELPELYLDFSSFISGITVNRKRPSNITGIITGLGDHIFDILSQDQNWEPNSENFGSFTVDSLDEESVYGSAVKDLTARVIKLIDISRVSTGTTRIGKVPIDVGKSHEKKIKLIGCDVGRNGDDLDKISKLGQKFASYGEPTLKNAMSETLSRIVGKIVRCTYEEELIEEGSTVCISGRRLTNISQIIPDNLNKLGFERIAENLVFVENPASFADPL